MEQQELIETGAADIASSLGLGSDKGTPENIETDGDEAPPDKEAPGAGSQDEPPPPEGGDQPPAAAAPRVAPKSWAKEMHEHWGRLDPAVQEYLEKREGDFHKGIEQYREYHATGKALNEVLLPYRPMIQAAGLDDAKAVAALLSAHYRLTQGPTESRRAAYLQLGQELGFGHPQGQQDGASQMPPEMRRIVERQERLEAALLRNENETYQRLRAETANAVNAFADAHPEFDEVSTEVIALINAGDDLETAFQKALRANPSTWAKEQARLRKEVEDELRKKAKGEVDAARSATAANVRGRDTARTPTEPKGKFLDEKSMLADLEEIKRGRATH